MKIGKSIATIIMIVIIVFLWNSYQKINMNMFTRAEFNRGITEFSRDDSVKYSENKSYKMKSDEFNDAMLYTTIDVKPNTAYRITCMVKTNNVIPKEENKGAGACISIVDTAEQSKEIIGTNDWQMLELKFNSKNRESIDVGARLGGNGSDCTGEVWFSDFKIEEGFLDTDTSWKFGCFVIKNTDVVVDKNGKKEKVQISMSSSEIMNIKSDIERFETACSKLSKNKMKANCDLIFIDEPLTSLNYEEDPGYFVSAYNVKELIDEYVEASNYDHIFTIIKLDSEKYHDIIEINDWVGLGYMDYYGIGFSNIRIPSDSSKFMYIYDSRINTFPEEVFVHEFLHSLERTSNEYSLETVNLHDYEKYGYKNDIREGQKEWYSAYMNKAIYDSSSRKYIGLDEKIYTLKPVNNEDFKYAIEIEGAFIEPENIIEEIVCVFKNVTRNLNVIFAN